MQTATPDPPAGPARPRWHRVYFWLAAFDVLTVSLGLLLTHLIMDVHTRSVALNKRWVDVLHDTSELGERAAAVNEPGNRVFGSGQVEVEKANLASRHREFRETLRDFRGRLADVADAAQGARLELCLVAVEHEMARMLGEADRVFTFLTNDRAEAGKAMTAMDQRHADVNRELANFRAEVGRIQDEHFTEHTAAAAR